ncbi:MAG: CBS domain-containing protein [Planctomycetales bacterium]|nr:CBS domain-containing protein [Planctomycetales bacterium]
MTTHVRGLAAHQSIQEAAELMSRMSIGSVPIFRDGQPVGIVTDRDISVRAVARGFDCRQRHAEEIMSENLCMLPEKTPIKDAAREMEQRQIRRVLVTGANDEVVGIVSVGDIAAKSNQQHLSAELIEKVSVPCEPTREFA